MFAQSIIVGRLGGDPEVRETNSGTMVANFSVATNKYVRAQDGDGYEEQTEWHRVVAWGDLANRVAQMAESGTLILVIGEKRESQYEDREGITRRSFKVRANKVEFLADLKPRAEEEFTPAEEDEEVDDGLPW